MNIKKLGYTILLSLIMLTVKGQQTEVTYNRHFSGTIDKYAIEMTISSCPGKDSVTGVYYYTKKGRNNLIYLNGTLKNNTLNLQETVYASNQGQNIEKLTGYMQLRIQEDWKILGSWTDVQRNKKLTVSLNCLETPERFNPLTYKFKAGIYRGQTRETYSGNPIEISRITGLRIYNSSGSLIQTITGLNQFLDDKNVQLELEDLNFDGLMDFKIAITFPDRLKYDSSFLYFIYNPDLKKFIRNKELEKLEYLTFSPETKLFYKMMADGSGNESTAYYKWQDGQFYLIKKEESFENDTSTHYTEYQIINRKSVKLRSYKVK